MEIKQQDTDYNIQAAKALGEELRERREKQGLELTTVADRLKLSVAQIQALERGDYVELPGLVFVTGFLRSYARLLKWDEKEISGRLKEIAPQLSGHVYAVNRQEKTPHPFNYQQIENKAAFPKWILGVATLALIVGGVYAWQSKSNRENIQQHEQDSSAVQSSLQAPELKASNVAISKMADDGKEVVAASQASSVAASAASDAVVVAPDELWIKVRYRSNLIVKDKDGKMIFSRIIPAESEKRFKGGAPYDVWVGIAIGAEANYGGTPISLAAHMAGAKSSAFIAGKK